MWQDVDCLPSGNTGCKGNLSFERGYSLQHTPDCSLCIDAHTLTQPWLLKGWPLPLDRSRWQRGYTLPLTVALCCPPGDGAQPLQPAESWPTSSLMRRDLHVLQTEVKSRAVLEPTPSIQTNAGRCFICLLTLNELQIILYSSVSQMSQQCQRCRARVICFARCCLKITDRALIKPEQIQNPDHCFIVRWQEIAPCGLHLVRGFQWKLRGALRFLWITLFFLFFFYYFSQT